MNTLPLAFGLVGHTALVTGGSSGLGRHFAATLARAGATVAVAARRTDKLAATVAEIEAAGGRAFVVAMDVTDVASVRAGFNAVETRYGIRVNALAPGYFETELNRDFLASDSGQRSMSRIPQRRFGRAADLDRPLLLLASDAGAYFTGSVIAVDGGHLVSTL